MKLKKIECPYCGGIVETELKERNTVFCTYCGQQIYVDNDKKELNKNININKNIHKHYTNEADVIRAKNEENANRRDFKQIIILFGILILIPIAMYMGQFFNKMIAQNEGKVSAGYYSDLVGKDYKTVKAHFESAGFTNIELIDLNDTGLMFWNKDKVETISIGGKTSFDSTDFFNKDVKVVISYH